MIAEKEKCPPPGQLTKFLLGNLPADENHLCQKHLESCNPCIDTICGLKFEDTLDDLTRQALRNARRSQKNAAIDARGEDSVVMELVAKMKGLTDSRRPAENQAGSKPDDGIPPNGIESRGTLDDRAAEVQRLLDPPIDDADLGCLAHYRLTNLLGAGSTGVVYKAFDSQLQREVALKILRPSLGKAARDRFVAEARATAAIDHPNVVTIFEVGTDGPLAYIAMQWLPGQTLEQILSTGSALAPEEVKRIAELVALGLAAAHSGNLIHRDIKPANIWITENREHVKILDFGLVRIADEDPQLTCTGMIAGTPSYMSPEQSRGESLDGRSDLFSLGCVMYQSLTGRLPFRSENALATLQSIQRDHPIAPAELNPSIPVELSDLVMCLLAKSPDRRPPQSQAFVDALQSSRKEWAFEVPKSVVRDYVEPNPKSRFGNRWGFGAIGIVAAGIAIVILGVCGFVFAPQITRIVTNRGEIIIESKVDDVQIEVFQNGQSVKVIDLVSKQSFDIKAGSYEIRPMGDQNSISITNNTLTLSRGETEIVTVTRKPNPSTESSNGDVVSSDPLSPYLLDTGDTLGIYIEGVLGKTGEDPPVHFPPPSSGLPPTMGFPIQVGSDGKITLPLIKPITARGKTIDQIKSDIRTAYTEGDEPFLFSSARFFISLMQKRNYVAPKTESPDGVGNSSSGNSQQDPYDDIGVAGQEKKLEPGDVLGIFIEHVLGSADRDPPVNYSGKDRRLPPTVGFPIPIDEDGTISLPLVKPIHIEGDTILEVRKKIVAAYTEGELPILTEDARILINVMWIKNRGKNRSTTPVEKGKSKSNGK